MKELEELYEEEDSLIEIINSNNDSIAGLGLR